MKKIEKRSAKKRRNGKDTKINIGKNHKTEEQTKKIQRNRSKEMKSETKSVEKTRNGRKNTRKLKRN